MQRYLQSLGFPLVTASVEPKGFKTLMNTLTLKNMGGRVKLIPFVFFGITPERKKIFQRNLSHT